MQGVAVSDQWTGSSDAGTFLRVVFDLARLLCRDTGHERRWYDFRDFPMNWFKQALRVGWCGWTHWPSLLDHPLSYSSITVRRCLLNAILIILRPDMEPMPYREHYWGFAPSVAWLFDVLDDDGKKLMADLAQGWPPSVATQLIVPCFASTLSQMDQARYTFLRERQRGRRLGWMRRESD